MKPEIKLVVTDLDGTFTTSKYHFCPENARAIQRAQQAGVMVCACTAVSYTHLDVYKRQLVPRCGRGRVGHVRHTPAQRQGQPAHAADAPAQHRARSGLGLSLIHI